MTGSRPAPTRGRLLDVMRRHRYAVECSVAQNGSPEAAIVGVAVSNGLDIVFDTLGTSRKAQNLRAHPAVAFVFGSLAGDDEETVQFEGVADEPAGAERDWLIDLYLSVFPDGRDRQAWPHLTYFRARPTWIRYSNFNASPPELVELDSGTLHSLR
jgi:general stress protein 26